MYAITHARMNSCTHACIVHTKKFTHVYVHAHARDCKRMHACMITSVHEYGDGRHTIVVADANDIVFSVFARFSSVRASYMCVRACT